MYFHSQRTLYSALRTTRTLFKHFSHAYGEKQAEKGQNCYTVCYLCSTESNDVRFLINNLNELPNTIFEKNDSVNKKGFLGK